MSCATLELGAMRAVFVLVALDITIAASVALIVLLASAGLTYGILHSNCWQATELADSLVGSVHHLICRLHWQLQLQAP